MRLKEIDRRISDMAARIDFYSMLTPLNAEVEKDKFFDSIKSPATYEPKYEYEVKDLSSERDFLRGFKKELSGREGIAALLYKKVDLLIKQIDFLAGSDSRRAELASVIWELPSDEVVRDSLKVLTDSKEAAYSFPEETVTPRKMRDELEKMLREKQVLWKVELTDRIVPKINVSAPAKTIFVNARKDYTPFEIDRLRVHEIGVHVLRGENGARQQYLIFRDGCAGYNVTEEGLALFAEEVSGMWDKDTRQLKLYAGRALSARWAAEKGFLDTFKALSGYFPADIAYRLTERCKRGIRDTSLKGGVLNGANYMAGLAKVKDFLKKEKSLRSLLVGKTALEDSETLDRLLREGEVKAPLYFPEILNERRKR